MSMLLLSLGVIALVAVMAAALAELALLDRFTSGSAGRRARAPRRAPGRRRARREVQPTRRPVQQVAADLRRLSRQLALVPAGAPLVRWRALWAAYDEVLTEAAELLEVPHTLPETPVGTARDIERIRVLAALEGAGLVVRG
jgi:hypothetical protein